MWESEAREFQFHKGTIKTVTIGLAGGAMLGFQFHKGTIKTLDIPKDTIGKALFQFHKGTIKTPSSSNR